MDYIAYHLKTIEYSLKKFSVNLTKNSTDGKDLYQDTLVKICLNINNFQKGTNFEAWSMTIMRNVFFNDFRKKNRRKMLLDHTNNSYFLNANSRTIVNEGEENIGYEELIQLVNNLKDNLKVPFLMIYQGYKYQEIAKQLNIPEGTVKSRVSCARKKLQKMYAEITESESVLLEYT